jgi:hypothetical protein
LEFAEMMEARDQSAAYQNAAAFDLSSVVSGGFV